MRSRPLVAATFASLVLAACGAGEVAQERAAEQAAKLDEEAFCAGWTVQGDRVETAVSDLSGAKARVAAAAVSALAESAPADVKPRAEQLAFVLKAYSEVQTDAKRAAVKAAAERLDQYCDG